MIGSRREMLSSFLMALFAGPAALRRRAATADTAPAAATDKTYETAVNKAIEFLRASQGADGSFSAEAGPAVTAIVVTGILKAGRSADDPLVAKSLKYVAGFVHPDGGIYAEGSTHQNYETCIAIQCFGQANRDGRYDKLLADAEKFVRNLQWDNSEGHDQASVNYGGAGYGRSKRPDLSNTSFLLDALKSAGAGADDEAVQKALVFVSRCQNLESEYNTTPFAAKINDGGFYYTPAAGGSSQAGAEENGGLRSYGSMTYAGLKSMIYAGLKADDPRVKAALGWLAKHYTLDENPGMGNAGLYYYYQSFAKALAAVGAPSFSDAAGASHDWRADLITALASRQKPDGSWVNDNARWMEGNPNLVTGYALIALAQCRGK
ncbi:MAG: prenyltransferase/squalene oxidase repeat-containing protein [Pirellulales bacterium]